MADSNRLDNRASNLIPRLIAYLLALYVAFAPAVAMATVGDFALGGFTTANGQALGAGLGDAALGARGAGIGVAAAEGAAAAGVAAAAIGAGVTGFCVASYFQGANMCCDSLNAISVALRNAGIVCNPNPPASAQDPLLVRKPVNPAFGWYYLVWQPTPAYTDKYMSADSACSSFSSYLSLTPGKLFYFRGLGNPTPPDNFGYWDSYSCEFSVYGTDGKFIENKPFNSVVHHPPSSESEEQPRPVPPEDVGGATAGSGPAAAAARAAAAAAAAGGDIGAQERAAAAAGAAAAGAQPLNPTSNCGGQSRPYTGTFNGQQVTVCGLPGGATGDLKGATGTGGETGTGTGTGEGTGTGTGSGTTPKPFELPGFCVWAQTVCDFIGWSKTEPTAATASETTVDVKKRDEADFGLPGTVDSGRVRFSGQCPAPLHASFSLMGTGVNFDYSFDAVCDFASKLKPAVIGCAALSAAYIVMGQNRTRSE